MRRTGYVTDWVIRASTASVAVGEATVAAYVSYQHAYELVSSHGETGATARLVPLTVDGLVYASSMAMLDAARHKRPTPLLGRWLLALGILATLSANVAHGIGNGPIGAIVAAWPAAALVGTYELVMALVRTTVRVSTTPDSDQNGTSEYPVPAPPENSVTVNVASGENSAEYDQYGNEHKPESSDSDESLILARSAADEYRERYGRWIPRDELRERLHCSSKRATELLRQLKSERNKPPQKQRNDDQKGGTATLNTKNRPESKGGSPQDSARPKPETTQHTPQATP